MKFHECFILPKTNRACVCAKSKRATEKEKVSRQAKQRQRQEGQRKRARASGASGPQEGEAAANARAKNVSHSTHNRTRYINFNHQWPASGKGLESTKNRVPWCGFKVQSSVCKRPSYLHKNISQKQKKMENLLVVAAAVVAVSVSSLPHHTSFLFLKRSKFAD